MLSQLLNTVIPQSCLLCGNRGQGDRLVCSGCESDLPWLGHHCSVCATPLPANAPDTCGQCQRKSPAYDYTQALFHYTSPVDKLITGLKFNSRLVNARMLGDIMAAKIQANTLDRPEALLPVPLHRQRLRERGFNPALELARPLAKAWDIPLLKEPVRRIRATTAQMELPAKQRHQNIRGAFECDTSLPYGHIAIVDDVVTTGATANELAKLLKKQGIRIVQIYAIARAS